MRKLILVLAFLFAPSLAWAQCTGVFPANTACGNFTGAPAPPSAQAIGMGTITSGSTFQMPFYQSAGTQLTPTTSAPTGFSIYATSPTNDQQPNGGAPVWNRAGAVLTGPNCGLNNGEHADLDDTNPVILTSQTRVIKKWYTSGGNAGNSNEIRYAEAPESDPANFTCYSGNPIISSTAGGGSGYVQLHGIVKSGSNYYAFPKNLGTGNIDRLVFASDGITLSTSNHSVIVPTGAPENVGIGNVNVLVDGAQWDAFFYQQGGSNTCSPGVSLCFWTAVTSSSDQGVTWGAHTTILSVAAGGPAVYKSTTTSAYWMWSGCTLSSDNITTDLCRFTASHLTSVWTLTPSTFSLARKTYDEGVNNAGGQLADPAVPLQINGQTLLYYTSNHDQTCATGASISVPCGIKLAIANMPLEQLITTNEGDLPVVNAGWGNPQLFGGGVSSGGAADNEHAAIQYVNFQTGGIGTFGANCFEDVTTNQPKALQPGINGYCQNFTAQNGDTSSQLAGTFINTAGSFHNAWGIDWQAGGLVNNFYIFGNSSTRLCLFSTGFGDCGSYIKGDDGDGILFGDFQGRLVFGYTQQKEIASPGGSSGFDILYPNSTNHRFQMINNNGNDVLVSGIVGTGTITTSGTLVTSGTCVSQTKAVTNTLSTDAVTWSMQGAPGSGWGQISVQPYVTAGFVNFAFCNPSASGVSPAAMTINYQVTR